MVELGSNPSVLLSALSRKPSPHLPSDVAQHQIWKSSHYLPSDVAQSKIWKSGSLAPT